MSNPILQVQNLSKSYGFQRLFTKVNLMLKTGEKTALVGPNGVGKSTLLQILAGLEKPDSGTLSFSNAALSRRYVPQMPRFSCFTPLEILTDEVVKLGISAKGEPGEALRRFGLTNVEARLPAEQLSGGQKTRLALALAWLSEPNLLLLDEPTNHLDLKGLKWLEEYIQAYRGTVLVVSHDRAFLDNVVSRILELGQGGVQEYAGNYTAYRDAKALAFAKRVAEYEHEQRQIERLERAIQLQMRRSQQSHQKAGQHDFYRSKAKKLAKTGKAQMRRLQSMRQKRTTKPQEEKRISSLHFGALEGGRRVIHAEDLAKTFGPKRLFDSGSFSILKGDKVALIGPNGSGKTTLLKMFMGREMPSAGKLWVSPSVCAGYLDQELEEYDPGQSVLSAVLSGLQEQTQAMITRVRTLLAGLLFDTGDLEKPLGVLSVGEQKRVTVAKLLLGNFNLLLVDEPTDHLDLPSREKLEQALGEYNGTLIAASHDRHLLRKITTKVIVIKNGMLDVYPGGFSEYELRQEKLLQKQPYKQELSAEERLVLETRLARLSSDLSVLSKEGDAYLKAEKEYLDIVKRLRTW
mgnify:FL=1